MRAITARQNKGKGGSYAVKFRIHNRTYRTVGGKQINNKVDFIIATTVTDNRVRPPPQLLLLRSSSNICGHSVGLDSGASALCRRACNIILLMRSTAAGCAQCKGPSAGRSAARGATGGLLDDRASRQMHPGQTEDVTSQLSETL